MIQPNRVKKAYKRVERENTLFRVYLKNNADSEVLDKQFARLHEELFANYDCKKCRNCCKEFGASFEDNNELSKVTEYLNKNIDSFKSKNITEDFGELYVKDLPCMFLKKDGSCKIEECQPRSCRDFPYTNKEDRLYRLINVMDIASICPVVFEMIERLKKEYSFI